VAYDTRDGGKGATPPLYSGSSVNPQPRNPGPDRVTCDPRAATGPPPAVSPLPPRPTVNSFQFPVSVPPGSPHAVTKPLT
jgi:hypothetical protein